MDLPRVLSYFRDVAFVLFCWAVFVAFSNAGILVKSQAVISLIALICVTGFTVVYILLDACWGVADKKAEKIMEAH